jgi:hypothetical protein
MTPPSPIDLPARALDLTGQRFGELTALYPVSVSDEGVRWLCRCDCGTITLRTTGSLRYSVTRGYVSCCRVCNRELRRGRALARREDYARMFRRYGSLYSELDHKEVHLGQVAVDPGDACSSSPQHHCHPISVLGTSRWWECDVCGRPHATGLGCLICVVPTCGRTCYAEHVLDEYTLSEVAKRDGVSRERIRQIEGRALRRLQHPSRARYLAEFTAEGSLEALIAARWPFTPARTG